ncbi:[citrate (pro-3S)-lyase] ligase [Proteiniborus ethanoligenes]|uniref:[Citrate [pro-3S]-lyase] ligase n=1 Tax=Proteiniborus ethanoligenes TaxID=415015 RepID=A0A1H3KZL2_9FIRM|nr:[citrate (pro-3S)-lyase] ligase [Proteiniborus ethanoligenes]SDY57603.1 [citrate (pro-3S)-lyase] ligase [Proteiniborus ethanoligenes]
MNYLYKEQIIEVKTKADKIKVSNFLKEQGLILENDVEYTIAILIDDKIVGTGSLSGRILKCIAVQKEFQRLGISTRIVSNLVNEAYFRGNTHLFIYTIPKNEILFIDVGFYKIAEVLDKVCLLENQSNGIGSYTKKLAQHKVEGNNIASIIMNCNPFTLGHQYIIEKAASENDVLHVFIVWENRSSFPSEVRYHLVKEGTKHISNIVLHKGKDYIISDATFPSYFIKDKSSIVEAHTRLDIEIFKEYIVPALGINKRYVGEEPYCPITKQYNETMKALLPLAGVTVEEVKRIGVEDDYISASKVRSLIISGELSKTKKYLPKTTYDFLMSKEGLEIVNKMKDINRRH